MLSGLKVLRRTQPVCSDSLGVIYHQSSLQLNCNDENRAVEDKRGKKIGS